MFTSLNPAGDPSVRTFEDNDLVFMEGDDSREMYVVLEGSVAITKKSKTGEVALATLSRGDFVGEMSLLESLPRSASGRAVGKTRLLSIQPGSFLLKIRRDPTFAFEMLQSLSRRIRVTNDALMNELGRAGSDAESLRAILQGAEYQNHELSEPKDNLIDSVSKSVSSTASSVSSSITSSINDVLDKVR